MKTKFIPLIVGVLLGVCLLLSVSGCAQFPGITCDHWQHQGSYGVFATEYEATGVVKLADGSVRIKSYSGNVKVLGGYGVTDTVSDLILTPAQASTAVADQKATSISATGAPSAK